MDPILRLGKNINRYCGETIDIRACLARIADAGIRFGWKKEVFFTCEGFELFALTRPGSGGDYRRKTYLSTGIHGDEPAGPLAVMELLEENAWPETVDLWLCPCLNPIGFTLNCRENGKGLDLNRAYRNSMAEEILAHIAWLDRQPKFDLCLLLHEDWEAHGFYLYEQNPDDRSSCADVIIRAVEKVCPVDRSESIEGRPAAGGIIRPNIDLQSRPDWPEAFYVITHKTRLSYTLEAPSDFNLLVRVNALKAAVRAALAENLCASQRAQ